MDEDNILPPNQSSKQTQDNDNDKKFVDVFDVKTVIPQFPKMLNITKYLNKKKTVNENHTISDRKTLIANYA